jgi:hypothetical protein
LWRCFLCACVFRTLCTTLEHIRSRIDHRPDVGCRIDYIFFIFAERAQTSVTLRGRRSRVCVSRLKEVCLWLTHVFQTKEVLEAMIEDCRYNPSILKVGERTKLLLTCAGGWRHGQQPSCSSNASRHVGHHSRSVGLVSDEDLKSQCALPISRRLALVQLLQRVLPRVLMSIALRRKPKKPVRLFIIQHRALMVCDPAPVSVDRSGRDEHYANWKRAIARSKDWLRLHEPSALFYDAALTW